MKGVLQRQKPPLDLSKNGFHLRFRVVDVVVIYSSLLYPHKTQAELQRLLRSAEERSSEPDSVRRVIRAAARCLGKERVEQLITSYRAGTSTTRLMSDYDLSKTAVLN